MPTVNADSFQTVYYITEGLWEKYGSFMFCDAQARFNEPVIATLKCPEAVILIVHKTLSAYSSVLCL